METTTPTARERAERVLDKTAREFRASPLAGDLSNWQARALESAGLLAHDDTAGEQALAALDELRTGLAKWERRLTANIEHYDQARTRTTPGSPADVDLDRVTARALAQRDVLRDVLAIIGR